MVCIAAFIILLVVGVAAALISIFNRDFGKKYLNLLKKSFHCFGKRVRLQKCDTNFSEDVKTTLLKKVVIKRPKLVKPLSALIEIASALLVILTIWSIVEAVKAGLALWVFGTCNVSQPSNCALGAESCSIDEDDLNWFTEWGEIFSNIPDRIKTWDATSFIERDNGLTPAFIVGDAKDNDGNNITGANAIEIIDPGCSVCLQSYKNILADSQMLAKHNVAFVVYPIKNPNGEYRFKNSELITRYTIAVNLQQGKIAQEVLNSEQSRDEQRDILYGYSKLIINRIFTEFNADDIIWQSIFNDQLSGEDAATTLDKWLIEWGMTGDELSQVHSELYSETTEAILRQNEQIITEEIRPKGIPTAIYDGKKHLGLFK